MSPSASVDAARLERRRAALALRPSMSPTGPAPDRLRVVPHGRMIDHWHYHYKLGFLDALAARTRKWLAEGTHVVVAGDLNVAATDSDVFHPDAFVGSTHVTPEERAALRRLLDTGLVDLDVACWGPGRAASPGGTTGSATPATSACAST